MEECPKCKQTLEAKVEERKEKRTVQGYVPDVGMGAMFPVEYPIEKTVQYQIYTCGGCGYKKEEPLSV